MNKVFVPGYVLDDLNELSFDDFFEYGVKNIILDADNTLVPYYEKNSDEAIVTYLKELKNKGFNVIIMSNNFRKKGLYKAVKELGINYYSFSLKPLKMTYKKLLKENGIKPDETVQIGDQILTDVIGANRMGIKNIYVKPIIDSDNIFTIFNRIIEKRIKNKLGI